MASKWEKLKGKLPDAPASDLTSAADTGFLPKVEECKSAIMHLSLPKLMAELTGCNQEWDDLEERRKELNVQFEAIGQLIKERFGEQGVTSVKSDEHGKTFYLAIEPVVSVKPGRREDLETWVAADPDLDYMWGIHPQTLSSWAKDKLENLQDDQIPEFLNVWLKTSVRVR